jgi:hypothetical protein
MGLKWNKQGLVFKSSDHTNGRDWLNAFAQGPATLIFDDYVRVYFSCRPASDENGMFVSYSSFVDLDRKDLSQIIRVSDHPILPLGDLGCFDEFGTYPVSVVREDDHSIKAYYGGWTRCESVPFNVAIGCAQSFDNGETFTKMGQGPIISYSPDEPFIMSGPKIRKFNDLYMLYYIAGKKWIIHDGRAEPVYTIRLATSKDGVSWTKENLELIPPRIEDDECQASPDVIFHNGQYHMFFCYRKSRDYRGKYGGYRIGYAHSADGFTWVRNDDHAGITISDDEADVDGEMVAYPHVFELDGQLHMFYLGNGVGRDGFCWATLDGDLTCP